MDYNLSESYVHVGGNGGEKVIKFVDDVARKTVMVYPKISLLLIIVLVLLIIWFLFWKCKEHFNPTQTLRDQTGDQFGLGGLGSREHLEPNRGQSAFAQSVQDAGGSFNVDPAAQAGQPGSLAYQVLHSSDFNCDTRKPIGNDAWAWMGSVANESMVGHPKTDNTFSKTLAGY